MAVLASSSSTSTSLVASAKALTQYIQTEVVEACSVRGAVTNDIAKQYGPSIVKLLRSLTGCLTACAQPISVPVEAITEQERLEIVLALTASAALDAMDVLRSAMKGGSHELDVQRYNFVRRFLQLGLYQCAFQQGVLLVDRTCADSATEAAGIAPIRGDVSQRTSEAQIRGDINDLQLAAVTSLMVCVGEMVSTDPKQTFRVISSCTPAVGSAMLQLR